MEQIGIPAQEQESTLTMVQPGTNLVEISLIQGEDIVRVWPHVSNVLDRVIAISAGELTAFNLYENVRSGNSQLWVVLQDQAVLCAMFTEVLLYPTGTRVMNIYAIAGEHLAWWKDPLLAAVEAFAEAEQCTRVVVTGRAGWEKILKDDGYKLTSVYLSKSLGASHG